MITNQNARIIFNKKIITVLFMMLMLFIVQSVALGVTIDLNTCNINITGTYTYTGSAIQPTYTITDPAYNNRTLTLGTHYSVEYVNNINASSDARVVFTGIGDYQGRVTRYFTINPKNLSTVTITMTSTFNYDGNAHDSTYTIIDPNRSNTALTLNEDYFVSFSNNINAGSAVATFTGTQNYTGTQTRNYTINKITLTVTPLAGQSKLTGTKDPVFKFTYTGQVATESPDFNGQLTRAAGEAEGQYNITKPNSFTLKDKGLFKASNYNLAFTENVKFLISDFNCMTMEFTIPAGNKKLVLAIPPNSLNDYEISWGDTNSTLGTTAGFPEHTYANAGTYTVRVRGHVEVLGNINDGVVNTTGIYKDYYTFCNDLTKIVKFGDIEARRLGFSRCINLTGPIPSQSGFANLTSVENMFNGCVKLNNSIPANLFKNLTLVESAKNTFKGCQLLTGSLSDTFFAGCTRIKSYESTFEGCINIIGSIPENMFKDSPDVTTFDSTFKGMTKISGAIPQNLFAHNTIVHSFSQTFASCPAITSVAEKIFLNNNLATNYYRTFYACKGLTNIPVKIFNDNRIHEISNSLSVLDDYHGTFEDCDALTSVEINVFLVGYRMFADCNNLKEIILTKVSEIGSHAFQASNKLQWIKVSKEKLDTIGEESFIYTGSGKLKTYINKDNEILLNYLWDANNRILDVEPPKGTVTITSPATYPYTKTREVQLQITVTDNLSSANNCKIAILNDVMFQKESNGTIVNYQNEVNELQTRLNASTNATERAELQASIDLLNEKIHAIEIGELPDDSLEWQNYVANKTWTLTTGDGLKTVYVYFKDEMGNISNYIQEF